MLKSELFTVISLICNKVKSAQLEQNYSGVSFINKSVIVCLFTHIRLSTVFYKTGLVLMTGCDLYNNNVLCIYTLNICQNYKYCIATIVKSNLDSIKSLYLNACWYEREFSEFFGIAMLGSDDTRGLLLVYNNTAHPLRKTQTTISAGGVSYSKRAASVLWYTL